MTDPITKMYQGLTDSERGKLAWQYLAKGDELERLRIESTMTEQHFIGLPNDYRRALMAGRDLALFYAWQYWEQCATCLSLLCGCNALLHDDENKDAYKPVMALLEEQERRLLALQTAFEEVCQAHGLDCEVMRKFAGKPLYQFAFPDLQPDQDYLDGMREVLEDTIR